MKRTKTNNQPARKQLGILVDQDLWKRFRAMAIMRDKTATELLETVMRKELEEVGPKK